MASNTTITERGYETLLKGGFVDNIKLCRLLDNSHIYSVTAPQNLIPKITGTHTNITTASCGYANSGPVFTTKAVPSEIQNLTSQVQINLVNEECLYGDFNVSNLNLNINLSPWFEQLKAATYSYGMSESLSLNLWDFIEVTIQTLNLSTKTYENVETLTNLNLSYMFKTDVDKVNFTKFSPLWVQINGTQRSVYDNTGVMYGSPFMLLFSSYPVANNYVVGASGNLTMHPNGGWGYWVVSPTGAGQFLPTSTVENQDLANYSEIYPAAIVNNETYYLTDNVSYETKNPTIGYALKMTNVRGNGETMLTGLVNNAILFCKKHFNYDSVNNRYTLPINLQVNPTNQKINYITKKFGGSISLNFIYDTNQPINTNPIELISF